MERRPKDYWCHATDKMKAECIHCYKQKVKEIIEEIKKESESWHDNTTLLWTCNHILKKLGLDE